MHFCQSPRGNGEGKKNTDEGAAQESRKDHDGPSPAGYMVKTIDLRMLSASRERVIVTRVYKKSITHPCLNLVDGKLSGSDFCSQVGKEHLPRQWSWGMQECIVNSP